MPEYFQGPKLNRPNTPSIGFIENLPVLNGQYDICTVPVGDNWAMFEPDSCSPISVYVNNSCLSLKPRFLFNEASCGFVIAIRKGNPRGPWQLLAPQDGNGVFGRISVPVYSHGGSRTHRYMNNGYIIAPHKIGFPNTFLGAPKGPKSLLKKDVTLSPSNMAPYLSFTYGLSGKLYLALAKVDMFGRETYLSDVIETPNLQPGSRVYIRRNFVPEMGACGVHLYAGRSPNKLHRQPVLDVIGRIKYLWPIWEEQYVLNTYTETNISPIPSSETYSILNWAQQQIVLKKKQIEFKDSECEIYCPFLLNYDTTNFDRQIGQENRCKFVHKTVYSGRKLVEDIPLVYMQNQRDVLKNADFVSEVAPVGLTFSDFSGGQAFSNVTKDCKFELYGEDATGFLVDDLSSRWIGEHTSSETKCYNTKFLATTPILIEGNQSCQIKFDKMCSLWAFGNTRYMGDTAIIYAATPNDIDILEPEGIGGTHRNLVCLCCDTGQPHVTLDDIFVDGGCNVYVTVSGTSGGKVTIKNGDSINSHSQVWIRLIESLIGFETSLKIRDCKINHNCTAISYMLNQLSISLDFPAQLVVMPSVQLWMSKNLPLKWGASEQAGHVDFTSKQKFDYHVGFDDMPDTLSRASQVEVSSPVPT